MEPIRIRVTAEGLKVFIGADKTWVRWMICDSTDAYWYVREDVRQIVSDHVDNARWSADLWTREDSRGIS